MNFVSPFALWFLPLAVLPILIHLLSRRKYKHVYFSHLGFIQESLKHARRISRLTRLLTLLARTVLLIVLVFLFARPVIHYGGEPAESGATAMVILCDVSYSMAARYGSASSPHSGSADLPHGGSFTALNLAKEAGNAILNSRDLSNVTAIIAFSDKVEKTLPFMFRKDSAADFLNGLHTVSRPTNVYPALGAAGKLLSEVTAANKVIVILTDLAKHGWNSLVPSPLGGQEAKHSRALVEGGGEGYTTIVLVDVVPKNAGRGNLAVLSTVCQMQGSSVSVTATINNFGPRTSPGVLLAVKNGDVVLAQDKFDVKPGEKLERPLSFPVSAVKGERGRNSNVYVEITGGDVLDIDNRYYLRPEEFKLLRLLVVDGDPGASPVQSEIFYISTALSSAVRQIDYRVVTSAGMIQEKLPEWDVITLANLGEMEEQSVSGLVRYVAAGGKLLISGGDKAECCSLSWSSRFSGPSGLFGASIKVDAELKKTFLDDMVRGFEWEQIRVKRMLAVNSPRDSVTWLRAGGNPLLVSWKYGRGELMVFTSTIDREWTNMPAKPVFAPFWLEKFRYLGKDDDVAKPDGYFNPVEYSQTESDLTPADKGYIASRLPGTSVHKISFEGNRKTFVSRLKMLLSGKEMRQGLVVLILFLLAFETFLSRRNGNKIWFLKALCLCAFAPLCLVDNVWAQAGNEFVYAQLKYDGDWDPYPAVAADILKFLSDTTNVDVYQERKVVTAANPDIFEYPFLVISGKTGINFSELEIKSLRRYLENGGFVFIDDCGDFSRRLKEEMLKIVPNSYWKEIPRDHAVYRSFYLVNSARGRKSGGHPLEGLDIHGYTSVVLSSNDMHGAWAKDLLGNYLFPCEPGGEVQRMSAVKLMMNVIMYSLTGTYKTDAIHQPFIEQKLGR